MSEQSRSVQSLVCQALLFDLDGVLVDSSVVVERCWRKWAEARHVRVGRVVEAARGRRIVEVVRKIAPELDAEAEAARLAEIEARDTDGLRVIPGARELIASLRSGSWAVVTSGRRQVAEARLRFAELPLPDVFVTAEDVAVGKPDPRAFLAAAEALGVAPNRCVVLEDAPAGLAAAEAAGMPAIGVTTSHPPSELAPAVAHTRDLRAFRAAYQPGGSLVLHLDGADGVSAYFV